VDIITGILGRNYSRNAEQARGLAGAVHELADTMTITSICGLGMVAPNPIATVLKFFPEELDKYLPKGWRDTAAAAAR
jgi:NADH:ubiquinone oxidoreductase subunit F (NADH-binding)